MIELSFVSKQELSRLGGAVTDRYRRAELLATACRLNALYMIMYAGSGHIGSSFSAMDVVVWLYEDELDLAHDVYFSSKGHDAPGLYSVLIARGLLPFEKLHSLRRLGGLPGHPDRSIPYMHVNSGSLGMGVSKAKGLIHANRRSGRHGRVFVLTGDGELQEGQLWESLASAVKHRLHELTVIVDHNKVQSDTFVSRVSDLGDIEAKWRAFGWHVQRCDGHDLRAVARALATTRETCDAPHVIIADTIKGRGVSFMEHTALTQGETLYRFHSGSPSDEHYLRAVDELSSRLDAVLADAGATRLQLEARERPARPRLDGAQRLVEAYSRALVNHARNNPSIVALDADLVLDAGLIPFAEEFPERFFECGIAEQDMVSQAGGMALRGLLPVAHSFACFLSARPNEQLYTNATEGTQQVFVGSLAGLVPGMPGHSHQCVRDISSLGALPGFTLVEPSCEQEVEPLLDWCLNHNHRGAYLRLVSVPCHVPYSLPASFTPTPGRGVVLREGSDAVIIGYGPVLLSEAWEACERLLTDEGLSIRLVNLPWLNKVDPAWLAETVAGRAWLFTLDNHYLAGGQGQLVLSTLAALDLPERPRARSFGVRDVPVCGQNDEVLRAHGLDAESLGREILRALGRSPEVDA